MNPDFFVYLAVKFVLAIAATNVCLFILFLLWCYCSTAVSFWWAHVCDNQVVKELGQKRFWRVKLFFQIFFNVRRTINLVGRKIITKEFSADYRGPIPKIHFVKEVGEEVAKKIITIDKEKSRDKLIRLVEIANENYGFKFELTWKLLKNGSGGFSIDGRNYHGIGMLVRHILALMGDISGRYHELHCDGGVMEPKKIDVYANRRMEGFAYGLAGFIRRSYGCLFNLNRERGF